MGRIPIKWLRKIPLNKLVYSVVAGQPKSTAADSFQFSIIYVHTYTSTLASQCWSMAILWIK